MKPIASNTQRVCTRLTRKPFATDETANTNKKLAPTNPNSRGESGSGRGQMTPQQIEGGDVCDNEQRYVDERDRVGGAKLPRQRRKPDLVAVIIVDDDVDCSHKIEGDNQRPKDRTYPHREKRQHGQQSGCEVTVGGECGESGGQIGADDARNDEDESEEAEAVQSGDGALRFDPVHCLEPRPDISAKPNQPPNVPQH